MPKKIEICLSGQCSPLGATALVRDMEDLAGDQCLVLETGCLGKCGNGPNLQVSGDGPMKTLTKVNKFSRAVEILEDEGCHIDPAAKKSGKEKWSIRREEDAAKRSEKLAAAFKTLGGEDKASQNPDLFASLFVMRANYTLKASPKTAAIDARRALQLAPKYVQAYLACANAMEAISYSADGVQVLQQLLDLGRPGVNKTQIKKLMGRMERKVEGEAAKGPRPSADDFLKAAAAPKAKAKPKASKAKAKGTAAPKKKEEPKGPTPEELEAKRLKEEEEARVQELMNNPPLWFDWKIESVKSLNQDCIEIRLICPDTAVALAQWTKADETLSAAWHIDFKKESADPNEEALIRAYTPVSNIDAFKKGILDIMLKIYPNGRMTSYVATLGVGDSITVSAPSTTVDPLDYEAGLTMVAGGSAVTIAYQLCYEVLQANPSAPVTLFMCNRQPADALYHDMFESLLEEFPGFMMTHCLSSGQVPEEAPGSKKANWFAGRISQFLLAAVRTDLKVVMSGPGGLLYSTRRMLLELGHEDGNIKALDPITEPPPEPEVVAPVAVAVEEAEQEAVPVAEPVKVHKVPVVEPPPEPVQQSPSLFFGLFCCRAPQVAKDELNSEFPAISTS